VAALPDDDPRFDAVCAALAGHSPPPPPSLRLFRVCEASKALGRSRVSLWRAISSGRIKTVTLRENGVRLIAETELQKLVSGRLEHDGGTP
jgi:hypothetical protein